MKIKRTVWVTTSFIAYHKWVGAPEEVGFLRDFHRHVFHVRVEVTITHNEREVEFILLKRRVDDILSVFEEQQFLHSCETLAEHLIDVLQEEWYRVKSVTVSEDGENGATLTVKQSD